ncbi:hypothetical protein HMPREF9194_00728 [Treponema maltophilum ATCC 51939]|uniref:Uncharacterized protein n=1 Tax=Treponema maltophilum ATCC 51939 TaxID=1125699 RepID=S3K0J1_TREMA|nr:hypothetical protein [Treponema maltophilum]EPF30411.1 hypothetical protein HMPREF9194_00728 [Treponema maltophilum ATCC 51939]
MKKITGILITVLLLLPAFTQQKNDTELKQYLIDNSFGGFKFAQDGTYTYYEKHLGGSVEGAGFYSVKDGILFFKSYNGHEKPMYSDGYGEYMELPGKYKVDLEKTGLYNKGALINISGGKLYWSNIDPPAYVKINYEDTIDGITAPWYLILAYGTDEMGYDVKESWVFGLRTAAA